MVQYDESINKYIITHFGFGGKYVFREKYREAPDAKEFLANKGLTQITILEDRGGILASPNGVNSFLPRLFVIDKYQIVQMDEGGLCPTCI